MFVVVIDYAIVEAVFVGAVLGAAVGWLWWLLLVLWQDCSAIYVLPSLHFLLASIGHRVQPQ